MEMREHRVAQGGLFHSHKVHYSKETQDLLSRLIEESKLSMSQRQALKYSVKNGQPLPGPECRSSARHGQGRMKKEVLVPPALPRRRSYQAIVQSGAYQRDTFHPPYNSNIKDREEEKQKLQSIMTYGKNITPDVCSLKTTSQLKLRAEEEEFDSKVFFDHLVEEIKERLEFLQEMERLGQAKKYQEVIEQEIAAKMRQMASIDNDKFLELSSLIDQKLCQNWCLFAVVEEIKERLEFLQEMERLGQAKKYQEVIEQEIAAKMRQMASIDNDKFLELSSLLDQKLCQNWCLFAVVEEIKERLEFLQEMERLGQAKKYQEVIEQEIAAKMRQMASIDNDKFLELSSLLDQKLCQNWCLFAVVEEIKERLEFLQEMERLGQAKKYQEVIEQEIAAKMRQMASIDNDKFLELSSLLDYKTETATGNKSLKNSFSVENNIFPCH